ncbi:MAG: hypothetical protein EOL90_03025 [Spartobacteria bacterium]|nr:hypothetical protein [Spartobacteria bacterium]
MNARFDRWRRSIGHEVRIAHLGGGRGTAQGGRQKIADGFVFQQVDQALRRRIGDGIIWEPFHAFPVEILEELPDVGFLDPAQAGYIVDDAEGAVSVYPQPSRP